MTRQTTVKAFFDEKTGTVSYVISDDATRCAAIVDPVLDFDLKSGRTSTVQADRLLAHVRKHALTVQWILETHAHADHLSGARYLQEQIGGRIAVGERIREVQATFKKLYNLERNFLPDGAQFDHLFTDGEVFAIGGVEARALSVPGHTPADMAYVVDGAVFVGDTLFMPDYGTARCDFPGGDARTLYRSIQRLLALPPETRMFVGHDYLPEDRTDFVWETTVGAQKASNIHVGGDRSEDAYVTMREARDATLAAPQLILPSLQINIRAGELPPPEPSGRRFLKTPINVL